MIALVRCREYIILRFSFSEFSDVSAAFTWRSVISNL